MTSFDPKVSKPNVLNQKTIFSDSEGYMLKTPQKRSCESNEPQTFSIVPSSETNTNIVVGEAP